MPEYLAPGVYVEETSFRQKSIEGVSTSTAAFVGPTRFGPTLGEPELLTSFLDFERIYGGIDPLHFEDEGLTPNDLAHAVRGFYENGGSRLYVTRAYTPEARSTGHARRSIGDAVSGGDVPLLIRARHPGAAGNVAVTVGVRAGQNILAEDPGTGQTVLRGAAVFDTVLFVPANGEPELYWVEEHFDLDRQLDTHRLRRPGDDPAAAPVVSGLTGGAVHVLTVTVTVGALGRFSDPRTWEDLAADPRSRRSSVLVEFAARPTRRSVELFVPIVIGPDPLTLDPNPFDNGVALLEGLLREELDRESLATTAAVHLRERLVPPTSASVPAPPRPVQVQVLLEDGSDGCRPQLSAYEGDADEKSGIAALEDLEDVSIVAAPGAARNGFSDTWRSTAESVQQALITHCERMRYRVAVLDSPDRALVSQVLEWRGKIDSTRAAFYYPWITILDPVTNQELDVPPSGFVAGVYARNDVERGVHKSPANEVVRLAVAFEQLLNKAQQDVLNPEGVNCLRYFEGRGLRIWGARTATSDPEWKYVALRRYFAFLERSIDKGTQWAVFEPNGRALWGNVRRTVEDFLFSEWTSGHLMGDVPEEAYFVRCDRSTMTQNDFDNGRLICLIGVAPLRPAEFVIFRIGQKTLESRG
ncbi:phage tail sheath family protein [Geodermatophilus sp. SYSU D01062]